MKEKDWEATGGLFCKKCHQEAVRLINGLCVACFNAESAEREHRQEDKAERRYYRRKLAEGTITLADLKTGRL